MKNHNIKELILLANHKGYDSKSRWVSVDDLIKLLERWKPIGEEYELSESDRGYIEACNELIKKLKTNTNKKVPKI